MRELRTTTGQGLTIAYDPLTNALVFCEADWFADPLRSTAMPAKGRIVRRLGIDKVARLVPRGRRRALPTKAA